MRSVRNVHLKGFVTGGRAAVYQLGRSHTRCRGRLVIQKVARLGETRRRAGGESTDAHLIGQGHEDKTE
jgi:hypothetical protein